MVRRLLLSLIFSGGVVVLTSGEPLARQGKAPKSEQKKSDEKKKAEPVKPKPAEPTPPAKAGDPEPEETFDPSRPTNPFDLAHGLRDRGMADLAVEYLLTLDGKSLPADLTAVLPLELARARLDAVPLEPEEGRRAALLAGAKTEFDRFVREHPRHPRSAEASLSLARVAAVLARGRLARAMGVEDKDRRKAELATVRPAFDEAARRFADATKQIADQLDTGKVDGYRKAELTRDLRQAELEHGIILFRSADTYPTETTAGKKDRGAAITAAKSRFKVLADKAGSTAVGWAARAWAAECDYAAQNTAEADRQTAAIRNPGNTSLAAREGLRMSRFFEVQHKYEAANTPADVRAARDLGERWLSEFRNPLRPSPEQFSVQYYVAFLKVLEAKAGIQPNEKTKPVTVGQGAMRLFREAEKDLRALATTDNDYADRAARQRTQVIRLIIGDAAKPPESYPTFDECQMAALVQLDQGLRSADGEDRAKHLAAAAALYERAVALAGPTTPPRDKLEAQVQLVFVRLVGGQPDLAAATGESLARTASGSAAARAGALAVQAYLQSRTDANREKALVLADHLEKTFPDDPPTDAVRVMHAEELLRRQQPEKAFQVIDGVSSAYPDQSRARLLEGIAGFYLIGPTSDAPEPHRRQVYEKVVADLAAVPAPPASAPADDARTYLRLRQQLASLHLLAEKPIPARPVADEAIRVAGGFENLSEPVRKIHQFELERLKLMAVVATAKPRYDARQYAEMAEALDPTLAALAKTVATAGSATKQAADLAAKMGADGKPFYDDGELGELSAAADKLDRYRRDVLVVLALQGRIHGGQAEQAAELVTLLKRLGGNLEANAQTLATLARTVRDQSAELRKKGQAGEADKLVAGVGALFEKIAAEPNQTPAMRVFLGIALRDLGRPDRACELLEKTPAPPAADLAAPFASLSEEKKSAVRLYRTARLELAKAHRLAGRFDAADEVLAAAMKSWAKSAVDFRKEANLLLEARAAAADDAKTKAELWGRAKQGWDKLANEYAAGLQALYRQPLPADDPAKENEEKKKRDQVKAAYFDLFADALRCVVRGNADLLKDKPEALAPKLRKVAEQMVAVETKNADLPPEVRAKFAELFAEAPGLKEQYEKAGGKVFTRPPDGQ